MRKLLLASAAIIGLAVSTFAPNAFAASGDHTAVPSAADIQRIQERQSVLVDAHLPGMKAGLKLNEEQMKNWPAFEAAIRDAAKARSDRWTQARERMAQGERPSPIERMTIMADHIEKSAADLRKVIDASKPLYASLDDSQKRDFGPLMREFKPNRRP
jgi:zinc resistance-associated protein